MRLYGKPSGLVAILLLAVGALWLAGGISATPALILAGAVAASAAIIANVLHRDADALTRAIRQLAYQDRPDDPPRAWLLRRLADEIALLSRRLAANAAVLEQHRRADTQILERLPDPVIVLARDRAVRRSNAAAREAFARDIPSVLRHPAVREAIDGALADGAQQTADITLPAPVQRDLLATAVPINPPLADGGAVLLVLSDRTRERLFERMRADFVANVSHELRTPLASLIGFTETLRGPAADDRPAQQRFLAIMAEQGARMNRLIDDLLSLSRIELTEHQPPSEQLDLTELVPRVAAGFEPRMAERLIRLSLHLDETLPTVQADADQIAQVLQNLMDNAVKYGRDGGSVALAVNLVQGGQRWPPRPGVVIAVADEGAGIPAQHLPRLTERFYRVDKGRSRAVGGTGLGLAIVKHIVNRHRGQLVIESEEGKGTTVSVWLPVSQAAAKASDAG